MPKEIGVVQVREGMIIEITTVTQAREDMIRKEFIVILVSQVMIVEVFIVQMVGIVYLHLVRIAVQGRSNKARR